MVRYGAYTQPLGAKDVLHYLKTLLEKDPQFKQSYKEPLTEHFLRSLLESGLVAASIPGVVDPKNTPVAHFEYNGKKIPIGSPRLQCLDVLFNPSLAGKQLPSLLEALKIGIESSADPERRLFLWENIILCGGLAGVPGKE